MSVFGMAMGLIVVDILMRLCMIEKKHAAKYKPVSTANGFYGTFTNGSTSEHEHSNGSAQHNKPHHDSEHAPLLDNGDEEAPKKKSRMPTILVLLSMPRLLTAIYGIFVNVSILAAFDGVLPLYVKGIFHWNSLNAGLIFMCLAIPALTGPLVGKLSDKVGPRWIAVAGCSLTAPPLILLRLVDHNSAEQKILLCALLVCCGGHFFYPSRYLPTYLLCPTRISPLILQLSVASLLSSQSANSEIDVEPLTKRAPKF